MHLRYLFGGLAVTVVGSVVTITTSTVGAILAGIGGLIVAYSFFTEESK